MRRTRCKRNQKGGGLGGIVEFAPADTQRIQNPLAWKEGSSCIAAERQGFLNGVEGGGLPGMNKGFIGGGRKMKKGRKGSRRGHGRRSGRRSSRRTFKQHGGRYGFDGSDAALFGGSPRVGSLAPITPVPCEASRQAIPDSRATGELNIRGGYLWKGHGGALTGAPVGEAYTGTVPSNQVVTWPNHGAASGSPSEMVPTARYTQNAEPGIVTQAGGRLMVNTPLGYSEMNPACKQTGGSRRRRGSRKGSRKSRKSRKGSRKNY
jgi:hypothetical protein